MLQHIKVAFGFEHEIMNALPPTQHQTPSAIMHLLFVPQLARVQIESNYCDAKSGIHRLLIEKAMTVAADQAADSAVN